MKGKSLSFWNLVQLSRSLKQNGTIDIPDLALYAEYYTICIVHFGCIYVTIARFMTMGSKVLYAEMNTEISFRVFQDLVLNV